MISRMAGPGTMARLDDLASLKARLRITEIIAKRVKLVQRGGDWWGQCPFHQEKTGSFSVNDAKGFYHCFGCHAHGDILDWWQKTEGLSLADAIGRLKQLAGEVKPWRENTRASRAEDRETLAKRHQAQSIWAETRYIGGTIAETYLRTARRIRVELPLTLRFHPGLPLGGTNSDTWPAMVASVTDLSGQVIAIQRTFIARDGSGKALIQSPKRSLGSLAEGSVQLGPSAPTIGIAEGIETGLSAMERFAVPVWCALGSNLARIALHDITRNVMIFADRGEAGEHAAEKASAAFRSIGRRVAVRFPADNFKDFNDELKALRNG